MLKNGKLLKKVLKKVRSAQKSTQKSNFTQKSTQKSELLKKVNGQKKEKNIGFHTLTGRKKIILWMTDVSIDNNWRKLEMLNEVKTNFHFSSECDV